MATTTKVGSRRETYRIPTRGGRDEKYGTRPFFEARASDWVRVKPPRECDWRASLVPAAAVIPAPGAYVKVAAVKKLVVEVVLCAVGG